MDALKYQGERRAKATAAGELMTVKVRFTRPDGDKSRLTDEARSVE